MSAVKIINPIASDGVTTRDLIGALLSDVGCSVGNMPKDHDGDEAITSNWEWFDPFTLRTLADVLNLPAHWRNLVMAMNSECWSCGYRYVHAPVPILGDYPRVPRAGIFGVVRGDATPDDVAGKDLIHLGGQFTEYDTDNAGIIEEMLEIYCSEEAE